jgi:hypothetical protein
MRRLYVSLLVGLLLMPSATAWAHGVVGDYTFLEPIVADDANPKNDFDILRPQETWPRDGREFSLGFSFEKTIIPAPESGLWLGFAATNLGDRWVVRTAPRVSRVAGWSVAVVVFTGLYNAHDALGLNLYHLLYSAYGRTLLFKVALFGVVLGIGGYNRYRLVPAVEDDRARAVLLRNVTVETVFLVGVLGIAALLANTPPAHRH